MSKLVEQRVTKTRGRRARVFFGPSWTRKHDMIIGHIQANPWCTLHEVVAATGISMGAVYEHIIISISAVEVVRQMAQKSTVTTGKNTIWRHNVIQVMDYKSGAAYYDANGRPRGVCEENRPVARVARPDPPIRASVTRDDRSYFGGTTGSIVLGGS